MLISRHFKACSTRRGLIIKNNYKYTFTNDNEIYTVFAPTAEALDAYSADTLNITDLRKFLLLHFIRGNMIFTDGEKTDGYYETIRTDEKSTPYSTVFTKIHLNPGVDFIGFKAKNGSDYAMVEESSATNILAGRTLGQGTGAYPAVSYNAVIHAD